MIIRLDDVEFGSNRSNDIKLENILSNASYKRDYTGNISSVHKTTELTAIANTTASAINNKNYLSYLERCWSSHFGIVISPDIIWYSLMCELSTLVASDVEKFRHIFSRSTEKQEITVLGYDVMPMDALIEKMREYVPTDIDLFIGNFSTTTPKSLHANYTAFADMASPYYNYCMKCCGFPYIRIDGTVNDYINMWANWIEITNIFPENQWFIDVVNTLKSIIENIRSDVFWKSMARFNRCGSGSDVELSGWITSLFREKPSFKLVSNWSSHISIVKYKNLDTGKNYEMKSGLFCGDFEDEFLVPDFGYIVYEKHEPRTFVVN